VPVPRVSSHKSTPGSNGAILVVTPEGVVRWADAAARLWLKEFFGRTREGSLVPQKIGRWLTTLRANQRSKSLIERRSGKHLLVSQRHPRSVETIVLWLEVSESGCGPSYRKHGPLTAREVEVLHWLGEGKANCEIAEILGIATATVNKHLERVYPKLGVENRTAAANVATELRFGDDRS
jgi:DNA-binding CsgD family transcriptional regulator